MQNFYGTTLESLAEARNERLWFKTQLKLCGLWFQLKEYGRASKILKELHKYTPPPAQSGRAVVSWSFCASCGSMELH